MGVQLGEALFLYGHLYLLIVPLILITQLHQYDQPSKLLTLEELLATNASIDNTDTYLVIFI